MASFNFDKFQDALARMSAAKPPVTAIKVVAHSKQVYNFWTITSAKLSGSLSRAVSEKDEITRLHAAMHIVLTTIGCTSTPAPAGKAPPLPTLAKWNSWVGTVLLNVFENYIAEPSMTGFVREVPDAVKMHLRDIADTMFAARDETLDLETDSHNLDSEPKARALVNIVADALELPRAGIKSNYDVFDLCQLISPQSPANYAAIVVFICSHTPGRGAGQVVPDYKSIMVARPKNIQDKFMEGQERSDLSGSMAMTKDTINWVGQAWEKDGAFRWAFYAPLCAIEGSMADVLTGPIMTSLHLSEDAYFTSMKISAEFILMYPWASKIPELSQAIRCLLAGPDQLEKYEPHLRLHAKVLDRDMCPAYNSVTLKPLASLAHHVLQATATSLQAYRIDPVNPGILAKYLLLKEQYDPTPVVALIQAPQAPKVTVPQPVASGSGA